VPYKEQTYPLVKCPVLMIQGLEDMWLVPALVTVPKTGHWIHVGPVQALSAADLVPSVVSWPTLE
jgi:hypothetical protein